MTYGTIRVLSIGETVRNNTDKVFIVTELTVGERKIKQIYTSQFIVKTWRGAGHKMF